MRLPSQDLDHVLAHAGPAFEHLRGGRIFLTGGTGFFGVWLLESVAWANERLGLNASVTVLTRAPEAFRARMPHLAADPAIRLHAGDMRSFEFPPGDFSHVLHAATETRADLEPLEVFESNLAGTRRVLDFTRASGAGRLLFTSSGAVYGKQPPDLAQIPEDYPGAPSPTDPASGYGEAKRASELLCCLAACRAGFAATIARCFAFIGPHLPLNSGFAAGNFLRDALAGGPIRVHGDGTPYRSYLYAADLAIWLWTILCRGQSCRPYNVGSPEAICIADLAREVAALAGPGLEVQIAHPAGLGPACERYVPSVLKAATELQLRPVVPLADAIRRTIHWHCSGCEERAISLR